MEIKSVITKKQIVRNQATNTKRYVDLGDGVLCLSADRIKFIGQAYK